MPLLRTIVTLAGLGGLYLVWSGQFAAHELEAAAVCAVLGALSAGLAARAMKPRFRFRAEDVAPLASAAGGLPGGTWRAARGLAAAALLGRGGGFACKRFVRGPAASEHDRARRAIQLIAECLAPDSYAVRVRPGRPEIEVHELPRGGEGRR